MTLARYRAVPFLLTISFIESNTHPMKGTFMSSRPVPNASNALIAVHQAWSMTNINCESAWQIRQPACPIPVAFNDEGSLWHDWMLRHLAECLP
jgi:hypothetical protein